MPPDTPAEDRAWAEPKRLPQPAQDLRAETEISERPADACRVIIFIARRNSADDRFRPFYERAKREGWGAYEIDSSHNPHVTCPEVLADLLTRIVRAST